MLLHFAPQVVQVTVAVTCRLAGILWRVWGSPAALALSGFTFPNCLPGCRRGAILASK